MQTECIAALPQFVCSYVWKVPPTRPLIFDRAQRLISRSDRKLEREAAPAEHPSVPWKAYLASREFEHLASDLTEAFFKADAAGSVPGGPRPATVLDGHALAPAAAGQLRGLLAPALPQGSETVLQPEAGEEPSSLAKAA